MRDPFLAMSLGIILGFSAVQFASAKLSEHAFWNCRDGKLILTKHIIYGDTYYCIKK